MRKIIRVTMRPFIRLLLRYGVGYGDFALVTKQLYIEVAESDFQINKRKQTTSRISVLTGIPRREIKKIQEATTHSESENIPFNHAARVITSWLHDDEFLGADRKAAPLLTRTEGDGTFNALVRKYGNNTPPRAILDELVRVGAVELDEAGNAKLISSGYVPNKDSIELLNVAMQSVADHITTIDFNDINKPDKSRLQLAVNYDNVSNDGVEVFRQISQEKSREVLLYLNRFLATQDRDHNPGLEGPGTNRTGLGIFFFEEAQDVVSDDYNPNTTADACSA